MSKSHHKSKEILKAEYASLHATYSLSITRRGLHENKGVSLIGSASVLCLHLDLLFECLIVVYTAAIFNSSLLQDTLYCNYSKTATVYPMPHPTPRR